jgi:DNA polymerase/3'-5' exonuclease PolX
VDEVIAEIADALEFKGENVFKVIAYRKAARVLEELVHHEADVFHTCVDVGFELGNVSNLQFFSRGRHHLHHADRS